MWFLKKTQPSIEVEPTHAEDHDNRVEVVVHKNATQEAIAKADDANQKLNELLVENGFTLKIYLAAGGKLSHQDKKKGI